MAKMTRDGCTAVVYSPGYGAGLSSWNDAPDIDINDRELCKLVLENRIDEARALLIMSYPDAFIPERLELAVAWVPVGKRYRINEYDGFESVEIYEEDKWRIA